MIVIVPAWIFCSYLK